MRKCCRETQKCRETFLVRGVFGMHCEGWIGGNLGKKGSEDGREHWAHLQYGNTVDPGTTWVGCRPHEVENLHITFDSPETCLLITWYSPERLPTSYSQLTHILCYMYSILYS